MIKADFSGIGQKWKSDLDAVEHRLNEKPNL